MTRTPAPRLLASLAALGGACWTAMGVLLLTRGDEIRTETLETTAAHLSAATMAAALALTVAGIALLARHIPDAKSPIAVGAGQLLLSLACAVVAVKGEDPSWFIAAAPVANGLWLFGSIAMARSLRRAGTVPTAVVVGLPLVWVLAIPFAIVCGPILAGALWMAFAASVLLGAPVRGVVAARAV